MLVIYKAEIAGLPCKEQERKATWTFQLKRLHVRVQERALTWNLDMHH